MAHERHKAALPVIPDLRFEYAYLRSVRPYVTVEHPEETHTIVDDIIHGYPEKDDPTASVATPAVLPSSREAVHVQWNYVLWVTTREQVIMPFLQGALWAVASYFLTPYSAQLGSKLGQLVHSKIPHKEGTGAGWLRKWVKGLGLTSIRSDEGKR